jgi:hypothetical protein
VQKFQGVLQKVTADESARHFKIPPTQYTYEPPSAILSVQVLHIRRSRLFLNFIVLSQLVIGYGAGAATIIWTGPTGADTNWSTGGNWTNATAATSGTFQVP